MAGSRSWTRSRFSERPAEVKDRAVPGHWEGDCRSGSSGPRSQRWSSAPPDSRCWSATRRPVHGHVVTALASHIQTLPVQLRRTLTWDRGLELADHKRFTDDTGVQVYFCDPKSP
jgi:IS30 family transposase